MGEGEGDGKGGGEKEGERKGEGDYSPITILNQPHVEFF